jgi:hypothetical protein
MTYAHVSRNGLILAGALRPFVSERMVARDVAAGDLVRVRRGAYVERERWESANARDRHIMRIHAVVAGSTKPVVLAGMSAAALWGMPVKGPWPVDVTVLERVQSGGRFAPGIRRITTGYASATLAELHGVTTTDLARTALDVARVHDFSDAVGSVDWALWRKNPRAISLGDLEAELIRLSPRSGRAHLERVVRFASPLSDSFYESAARAVMHQLGFAPPELQVSLKDAQGEIIPDYFWRHVRRVGEFDGKEKYTRALYTKGDPGETVWREKKREDRLRAMNLGVVRILSEHVANPGRMEQLLLSAGVPRLGGR